MTWKEIDVAVREGFEPSIRFRIHTFQACSFGHSDTSPGKLFVVPARRLRARRVPEGRGLGKGSGRRLLRV